MVRKSAVHIANRRQIAGLCSGNVLADSEQLQWISVLACRPFSGGLRSGRSLYSLSLFKKEHTSTSCSSTEEGGSCFEKILGERIIKQAAERPTKHGVVNPGT